MIRETRALFGTMSLAAILACPGAGAVEPSPSPSLGQNSFLLPKLEEIIKTAMRVIREDEGEVSLTLPGGHSFAENTQILFFRRKGHRLDVIATGKVLTEATDPKTGKLELKVELDKDSVIKYPVEGDYAAPLSDPNALGDGAKKDQNDFLLPEEDPGLRVNDRPGYLEVGMGGLLGSLSSTSSTVANIEKKVSSYRFSNFHIAYFSDFFPIGITLDTHSGRFPTSTYYSDLVTSDESVSVLGFHYRLPPVLNQKLEFSLRVDMLNDRFSTDNTDENLLTTEVGAVGFGTRVRYSFEPLLWKPGKKQSFGIVLQAITADMVYYPMLNAQDIGVSRGSNSPESSGYRARIGATFLAWAGFIPLFKRWIFDCSYGFRSYGLNFSGPVTLESVPAPVPIPEGTRATEREGDFRFFFGFRIDDPIRSLFSLGKKK